MADIDWLLLKVLKYFNNEIFHFDLDLWEIILKVFKYLNDEVFHFDVGWDVKANGENPRCELVAFLKIKKTQIASNWSLLT